MHNRLLVPGLIVSSLLTLATVATAQQSPGAFKDTKEIPPGPVGARINEVLKAVNSNDSEQVRSFFNNSVTPEFRDAFPIDEHLGFFASLFNRSQGFDFYSIRTYDDPSRAEDTVVIIKNRLTGGWQAFVLKLEPQESHRISSLDVNRARPPADAPQSPKLTDDQIVAELKKFVQKLADAEVFSGAVLVAKDGKVLFSEAWGKASREYSAPNKTDTKFNLGSMNKMFTAVAIAQLVQQGKLSFDDSLSKYLSEDWLPREIADKVTIHHLLTHTSGLGSYFNEKFMNASRELYRKIDDYKPVVADSKLAFEPGSKWAYSNTGFLLLGAVVEKVTAQSYYDYVRENIFKPAGMINTDSYEMDQIPPNLAIGYSKQTVKGGTKWVNNLYKHVIKGGPAGGGFSTVEDLLKFDVAMRSGKLLSKEMCEKLWTPKPEQNSPNYGYGFGVLGQPGNRIVGHSGGFDGISSTLEMYLDSGYTVAVMSNYDEGAMAVNEKIRDWLSSR